MSEPTIGELKMDIQPPTIKRSNNTKWIAAAIVVGLGLFGYIVSSQSVSSPQASSTSPSVTKPSQPKDTFSYEGFAEDVYLTSLREGYPASAFVPDRDLLKLGYDVCKLFSSGVSTEEYAYFIVSEFPYDEDAQQLAASVAGAAIGALCPENAWMLDY